jgi:hypothetical protein
MRTYHKMYLSIVVVGTLTQSISCSTVKPEWEHRIKYESIAWVSRMGATQDISVVGNEFIYFKNKQNSYGFPPGKHSIVIRYGSDTQKEIKIPFTALANHFYVVERVESVAQDGVQFYVKDYGVNFPPACRPAEIYKRNNKFTAELLEECT